MKFISWNVNGLRACVGKDFEKVFLSLDADFFCLQETKLQEGQLELELPGYHQFWDYAEKKGYSGTAIYTKHEPVGVFYGMGDVTEDANGEPLISYNEASVHNNEGRVITLEYPEFYFITVYVPNAQDGLRRLGYRMEWEDAFRKYIAALDRKKPVIFCGDLNVAHEEIDLKNPKTNHQNAGFSDEERGKFSALLAAGFNDTFRMLHPEEQVFSWWSYRFHAREKNVGWRIDYFVVSERLMPQVRTAAIHTDIMGSDHCPVELEIED